MDTFDIRNGVLSVPSFSTGLFHLKVRAWLYEIDHHPCSWQEDDPLLHGGEGEKGGGAQWEALRSPWTEV